MELQRLTSLKDIKVGDIFTIISPDFEDVVIQFIGRNPMINNEEHKSKSGYFTTIYGPKKCFILREKDLKSKDTEYYIGYDEKFALERRIEKIQNNLLIPLQERLSKLENHESNILINMKYQFKAKDLKTGEWVTGDLAYAESRSWKSNGCRVTTIKPMIVKHNIHGGMLYITSRHFIDENTLELISNGTENQI